MAELTEDRIAEGKLDLVPMIDCIMLLLLFFILTTKFTSEEKRLDCLLPTDKGPAAIKPPIVTPPEQVNICIYPAGLDRGLQPSEYGQKVRELAGTGNRLPQAWVRIGRADPMPIDGAGIDSKAVPDQLAAVESVHQYIRDALAQVENGNPTDREHQCPVVINCYSGMPWKFGMIAYDAVRAFESGKRRKAFSGIREDDFDKAREVEFAPPRIRNYDPNENGQELYEIVNMR